jgi:regulation of enolase protein 1 (concanavalin A-like superfamily)
MYAMVVSLLAVASATTQGGGFSDNFNTPHDYVAKGVAETGWDGFLGLGANETVTALNASIDRPGELSITSANGVWNAPWTPLGPFIYKMVLGDFVATVRVTNYVMMAYNYCGLMARLPNASGNGAGENWISIDYFPQYGCGIIAHNATNGARAETAGGNGTGTAGPKYLQLERKGNVFYSRSSYDGVTWTDYPDTNYSPLTRNDFAGLAVQVGVWQATSNTPSSSVAFDDFSISGPGVSSPTKASGAMPADKATDVTRDVILSWTPSDNAVKSDVYLGTSFTDVNTASRTDPRGLLVSKTQDGKSYEPPSVLAYGQTYYWRVDGTEANGTFMGNGDVWSFTVEPLGYLVTNIKATASSSDTGKGPENTINGSGMTGDLAGVDPETMWNTVANGAKTAWIQYTFDKVYKMQELWAWNSNSEVEYAIGYGVKDVTIQYSVDGTTWATLGDFVFDQATGTEDYSGNPPISLAGIAAKSVKIVVNSTWKSTSECGLSEVRFFYAPVRAREPKPATGSTNIDPAVTLSWRSGREAASHKIYLGTDANAVRDGLVPFATSTTSSYAPSGIELGATYYWQVTEVNAVQTPGAWSGDVWSFSTPNYVVVDDMESYTTDETAGKTIYQSWTDGYGTTANGSQVGYSTSANGTFGETVIIHGGRQSMPFAYNNSGSIVSEATRTFANPQDWTRAGIKTLVLFFRGDPANNTGQIYIEINGTKINYPGDAAIMTATLWKQWNIDLASVSGANLKAVETLVLGVSGTGKGILYFDDICLYKTAPTVVTPTNPGTTNLMACFTMEGEVRDTTGHGYTGTLYSTTFINSTAGFGKALQFNGTTSYVDMTSTISSGLLKNLTNSTFAVWVNYPATANSYGRVFDFGISSSSSFVYLAAQDGTRTPRFGIRTATLTERRATGPRPAAAGWHHLAVVIDASTATPTECVYLDGEAGTAANSIAPKDMGDTTNNWLGRSQYTTDPYFLGAIDDLRIYNRALTSGEIQYLAGDR